MKDGQYIRRLAEFITGEIGLPEFKKLVEERLFELRQNPEMMDEKSDLSSIELYLHEAEEGLRNESEVYAQAQFILDNIILKRMTSKPTYLAPSPPKSTYLLSRTFKSPTKQETTTKDLSLAISK